MPVILLKFPFNVKLKSFRFLSTQRCILLVQKVTSSGHGILPELQSLYLLLAQK